MLNEMKNKARGAPKSSQVRIDTLLDLCKIGQRNNKRTLENAIIALRHPALFGPKKVEVLSPKATGQFLRKKGIAI